MITRFRAAVDGTELDSLGEEICLTDIQESPPRWEVRQSRPGNRTGIMTEMQRRLSLTVTLSLVLRTEDPVRRCGLLDAVRQWMQGAYLTHSARPGKRLRVRAESLPAPESLLRWTEPVKLVFAAEAVPYWQDCGETILSRRVAVTSPTEPEHIAVPGTAPAPPDTVTVDKIGPEGLSCLRIRCGETVFDFAGLDMSPGDRLRVRYDDRDRLAIEIWRADRLQWVSGFACRTGDSDDDLLLTPGESLFEVTSMTNAAPPMLQEQSGVSFTATVQMRGRYL